MRITIKGESCYGPVDEAFSDKITITNSSIKYEYKPHPSSKLETNIPRKWSYTTDSPMFKELFRNIAEMTPKFLYSEEILFVTDIYNDIFKTCELQSGYKYLTVPRTEKIKPDAANLILN